jgi:hypothetical protein
VTPAAPASVIEPNGDPAGVSDASPGAR